MPNSGFEVIPQSVHDIYTHTIQTLWIGLQL